MLGFLKRFWTSAVSLAGIVGLYLGALAVHLVNVFWIVIAGSVLFAGLPIAFKSLLNIGNRYRNYPVLLEQTAELKIKNKKLISTLRANAKDSESIWQAGIKEGRSQILGAILGATVEIPELIGIREGEADVTLVGECTSGKLPSIGCRFLLETKLGGSRGAVEVFDVIEERSLIYLRRADAASPDFWTHLKERVNFNTSIPDDIELKIYPIQSGPAQPLKALQATAELDDQDDNK